MSGEPEKGDGLIEVRLHIPKCFTAEDLEIALNWAGAQIRRQEVSVLAFNSEEQQAARRAYRVLQCVHSELMQETGYDAFIKPTLGVLLGDPSLDRL